VKRLNVEVIRIHADTQSRVEMNNEAIAEYAEAIEGGAEFPPVLVFFDSAEYWLADGYHRLHAHRRAGRASIAAEIRTGTLDDAILHSLGANDEHGLRRTNADKRKSVLRLLTRPEWAAWSQEKIAKVCRVSHGLVGKIVAEQRASLHDGEIKPAVRTVERAGKTYQQDTSRIGKAPAAPAPAPAPTAPPAAAPAPAAAPQQEDLEEAREAVHILSEENERLNARLAVSAMQATDEEKSLAAETIESLRAQVKTLQAELSAVKASRDTYMQENAELKRQCAGQRRELDKLARGAMA